MRPIDADELTDKAEILYQHTPSGKIIPWSAVRVCVINNIKTIAAVPVLHGRWIAIGYYDDDGDFCTEYKCPFCGRIEPWKEPYCHCGAKMDGGKKDGV